MATEGDRPAGTPVSQETATINHRDDFTDAFDQRNPLTLMIRVYQMKLAWTERLRLTLKCHSAGLAEGRRFRFLHLTGDLGSVDCRACLLINQH